MKKILSIIAILLIASAIFTNAKLTSHKKEVENGYNFWLYEPDSLSVDSLGNVVQKPIVIFLHGASLCGRNLNKVLRYGTVHAVEGGREINAYILAPQNPGGAWNPLKINNLLDWAIENHSIDTTRVYVLGMSLGGYGTIDYTATYPNRVAAAMALCGGGTVKDYSGLNEVPLWIIHGTADRAVSVKQSRLVVDAMIECGDTTRLRYDEWKGVNHGRLARLFYMVETYDWLMSHSLNDSLRPVNREISIVNSDLNNAYRGLKLKKKRR